MMLLLSIGLCHLNKGHIQEVSDLNEDLQGFYESI